MNQLLRAALAFLLLLPALSYSAETPAGTARELIGLHLRPEIAQYLSDKIARYPTRGGSTVPGIYGNLALGISSYTKGARSPEDLEMGYEPVTIAANTSGGENTFLGVEAGRETTFSSDTTCIGSRACRDQTFPYYNTAVGHYASGFNIEGWKNTVMGAFAFHGIEGVTTAHHNSLYGFRTGEKITTGNDNEAFGIMSMLNLSTGGRNSCFGGGCMQSATDAYFNTCMGNSVCPNLTTSTLNTVVGYNAGAGITTGSKNTILGAGVTGLTSTLTKNIILANGDGEIKAQHNGTDWTLTGAVTTTGAWIPPSIADGSAPNNSVYYSSTGSKLSYKDAGGTVHALH